MQRCPAPGQDRATLSQAVRDDSSVEPYRIRMFAEIGCDFALWGHPELDPPTTNGNRQGEYLEHRLPIPEALRDQILAWAQLYYRYDGGERDLDMEDFDERGLFLSRELQRGLGQRYSVEYGFQFEGSRERLLPLIEGDPCPGWSYR